MTKKQEQEVIEAMQELIDSKTSLSAKGVPTVRAIEDRVGFDITAAERNQLMGQLTVGKPKEKAAVSTGGRKRHLNDFLAKRPNRRP